MGKLLSKLVRRRRGGFDRHNTARIIQSEPILGQDKYGIPGTARYVLKVVPGTGDVSLIGPELRGELKWLRGILAGDGAIYGIPANADAVLKIVPATGEVTTIGGPLPGKWKWHGGVLARDGCIYGIPCNADSVLKIDVPNGGRVSQIGKGSLPDGKNKWYGGLLGSDGCVYGIPNRADRVLKFDPGTQWATCIGPSLGEGGWKWHGGVVSPCGYIIGIPAHASAVLRITPGKDEVVTFGELGTCGTHFPEGRYKYGATPRNMLCKNPDKADPGTKLEWHVKGAAYWVVPVVAPAAAPGPAGASDSE